MKNFTKQNFKTNPLWVRLLIMAFMLLLGSSSAWAGGSAGGPAGVYLEINNTTDWYNIYSTNWSYNPCSGWDFKNATKIGQGDDDDVKDFGTVTTFKLKGFGIIGWCDGTDWVSGQLRYQVNSNSQQYYKVCNYGDCNSGRYSDHEVCKSNNDRVVGYKNSDIDLLTGLTPGEHTIKFKAYGQMLWNNNGSCGAFNSVDQIEKSVKFTTPGYSTTTGDKDFGEVDVDSSSDYTIELTHYGSDNTATVSITGTNKSEFTATIAENGNNQQTLTVTFKPTSVAPNKTATIKVTDAYKKTYTLTVTGTGKQSCQAPTSVSVTGSETPCVGANETYTADIVGGSKYDLEWAVPDGYTIIEGQGTTSIIVEVGTTSGNITCTATCGNEAPSGEISVAPYTTIAPTISLSTEYVCPGESATITVESPELNVEGLSYKLYNKNDTSTPIAIITEPKTEPVAFTIQEGTYYVTVSHTCGGEKKSINEKTLLEYPAPEIPAYTLTNATRCKDVPSSDGSIVLKNPIGGISYQLDKVGSTTGWSSLAAGTHKLSATVNACPSLTEEWDIEVGEEDITPSATVTISGETSFCEGGNTVLTSVATATQGEVTAYQWYNGDNLIQGATESTYTAKAAGSYKVVVTVENKGCEDTFNATKEVSVKNKPTTPAFNPNFTSICVGGSTTLASGYSWYTDLNASALANLTVSPQRETTYYAIKEENGCTSDAGTFTVKVNPLPTITSISASNDKPVLFEDVELTATGENIDKVEWTADKGTITKDATDPKKAILTYDQTGTVTVTATATSAAGCKSTAATKTVTFDEEDCSDDVEYDNEHVEIWLSSTLDKTMYLHRWYENGDKDTDITTWPGASTTKSDGYYKWITTSSGNIGYIFHDNTGVNKSKDANRTLQKGYRYYFTFNGGTTSSATFDKSERITTTTPKPITAPAVKTVSVNSEQGSGVVNFVGKVIKTGCAAGTKIYVGYQYKLATEPWPNNVTAGNAKGNLIAVPDADGKTLYETYSATISGLPDENYVFRAYIINGYNFTNGNYNQGVYYGIDIPVTVSTVKAPVTKATIQLTESDGTPVANDKKYCVGETGYIKVESDVKYTEISWKSQQGVDIVQTKFMNMYQFVVKGNDNIVVLLSNKYNVTPAESNTIEIYTFADPVLPIVSLNKVSICSNDEVGATVKLTNVVKGQTYQLYQQIDNGDGTFTEKAIGSVKTQTEEVTDNTELVLHTLTNTAATGKYFVKTYTEQCTKNMAATQPFTFTVVDATEVFISLDPISAETTPWMPAKFTVNASDKYTLNVTKGNPAEAATEAEVNQNGNNVSIKIPLPQGSTLPEGTTGVYGQYENVVFPGGATTQYTITATLSATGGDDNPCAAPANATITLIPYVEECTIGH